MEIRKLSNLSDEQLEEMLVEARAKTSLIENEMIARYEERRKKAWFNLVEAIEEYNKNYGTIVVEGRDEDEYLATLSMKNIDTSVLGTIYII